MNTQPVSLPPEQRALLREYERLHEEWRAASAAADAIECVVAEEVQRLMQYRLAADQLHQKAMRLLRDRPI